MSAKGPAKGTATIQRLLDERRKYESWLARLRSAADATPAPVRERVEADYMARLKAVNEELKVHAEAARQLPERFGWSCPFLIDQSGDLSTRFAPQKEGLPPEVSIINAHVVLKSGRKARFRSRLGDSFLLSALFCGS